MLRRFIASAVTAAALLALVAAPASAADTVPTLRLVSATVEIAPPPAVAVPVSSWPNCDSGSKLNCGYVVVDATFAGLGDSARPDFIGRHGDLTGSVNITRTYGCKNPGGKIVHHFDRTVTETQSLNTRRQLGLTIPATGDTLGGTTFAFLYDSQPGNCPKNFTPVNTSIVVSGVKLSLDVRFGTIIGGTYDLKKSASWYGVAPGPIAAYTTA
jgi:hypothetical protein